MKIAIPVRNERVDGHFGHAETFRIISIDEQKNVSGREDFVPPEGCGCKSNLSAILKNKGVSKMLAGNMGPGALNNLQAAGIDVIRGCSGNVDHLIGKYLAGELTDSGESCDHHEGHGHGNGQGHGHGHHHMH